jgi:hypothetical protein
MRVELLLVGAHNGSKQKNAILAAASRGTVILLEPVPYLYDQLDQIPLILEHIHHEQNSLRILMR